MTLLTAGSKYKWYVTQNLCVPQTSCADIYRCLDYWNCNLNMYTRGHCVNQLSARLHFCNVVKGNFSITKLIIYLNSNF